MNNIINFFKLIRVENLIILFFTQFMFYYYVNGNFGNISLYLLLIISFLLKYSLHVCRLISITRAKQNSFNYQEFLRLLAP